MIGFETIGNATLILHDGKPVLATDPWISGGAYFGSWGLSHDVPEAQLEHIRQCEFIWISHGHPDHLSAESLAAFPNKQILLPDHVGRRICSSLTEAGFRTVVLEDRKWYQISPHIRVLCLTDYFQDAVLLADVNSRLIVNINDATDRGWGGFVRRCVKLYKRSFLLKTLGYGDIDMINYFREDGTRILPTAAAKRPVGKQAQFYAELFGTTHVVPFSSFHTYQRRDSAWANQYTTPTSAYAEGFVTKRAQLLPSHIQFDCSTDVFHSINPPKCRSVLHEPCEFGDDWSELLLKEDIGILRSYLHSIDAIKSHLSFINLRVGGKDHVIELASKNFRRGITFEVPRTSLMTAVKHEVFDDLLIGNFMRTILHGDWGRGMLHSYFTPYVAKYADNGRAKTKEEVREYFLAYRKRAPLAFLLHRLVNESERRFRNFVPNESPLFRCAKKSYLFTKRML